ncbi:Response regulator receiver domain-containing protein [Paucidesulfovibrio gracilis DSM 16080]|uniref:Response regulator receiver domain-containing protein n=1 Tax=Paucidesulfovibrio gracilis DSM 16080 TaxID=1121449 RepID=A0A1T4Y549_9BACT|nr:response regulator [Paucidesulfovibrio gracilis]SKA96451.1 Response regulator receiver domain-containing protein [Paucidesulfovibrio gracilis DSM 16080]
MSNQAGTIRMLLVDDEAGFVDVMSKRLKRRDVQVTPALSGAVAIQILRKHDFDVAVVDLKMEDMDGIELLSVVKKMVPEMPVIMLTGHGSEQAAREGMEHGAFDYLLKPCELENLMAKIHQAVGK